MILKSQFGKPCPQKTSSCITSLIYVKNSVYHIYSHLKSNVAWCKENYFLERVFKEHFIELGLHGIFNNNLMSPTTYYNNPYIRKVYYSITQETR